MPIQNLNSTWAAQWLRLPLKNIFNLFKVVCSYNREEGKVTFSKGKLVEKIHFLKSGERGGPRGNTAKGSGFPDSLNWHAVTEERILLHQLFPTLTSCHYCHNLIVLRPARSPFIGFLAFCDFGIQGREDKGGNLALQVSEFLPCPCPLRHKEDRADTGPPLCFPALDPQLSPPHPAQLPVAVPATLPGLQFQKPLLCLHCF